MQSLVVAVGYFASVLLLWRYHPLARLFPRGTAIAVLTWSFILLLLMGVAVVKLADSYDGVCGFLQSSYECGLYESIDESVILVAWLVYQLLYSIWPVSLSAALCEFTVATWMGWRAASLQTDLPRPTGFQTAIIFAGGVATVLGHAITIVVVVFAIVVALLL